MKHRVSGPSWRPARQLRLRPEYLGSRWRLGYAGDTWCGWHERRARGAGDGRDRDGGGAADVSAVYPAPARDYGRDGELGSCAMLGPAR